MHKIIWRMPHRFGVALLLSASLYAQASVTIHTPAEAVNIAGKQRMYTMRLLRDYAMVGARLQYKNPASDLQKLIQNLTASNQALSAYIHDVPLTSELDTLVQKWGSIKTKLSQPPKKENMGMYADAAIAYRGAWNTFVDHLAKNLGSSAAQAVNRAGRLRMVSQALAAMYVLRSWGLDDASKRIAVPMQTFRASLQYLKNAPETKAPMATIVNKLDKIYLFFNVMNQSESLTPTLVIKKTDTMLKLASELTQLYVDVQ